MPVALFSVPSSPTESRRHVNQTRFVSEADSGGHRAIKVISHSTREKPSKYHRETEALRRIVDEDS